MKLVTWNVNSVKARHDRLLAFLERHDPDVVCLQELKVTDDKFPYDVIKERGYHAAVHAQKTYNGVAILSKSEPNEISSTLEDDVEDPQARLVAATINGVRVICVYCPNGGGLTEDKYQYKLAWMKRLRGYLDRKHDPSEPLVICGDYNVAPEDRDVAKPDRWKDSVLCHPESRASLENVTSWGLHDTLRIGGNDTNFYSWWDYRMLAFPKGDGVRIDIVYVTEPLISRHESTEVDRNERKGKSPSDHAPVIATFGDKA